jgi:hypothetical protein
MGRRRRGRATRTRHVWDVTEWQRAWEVAMLRIDGVPAIVAEQDAFHHAVDMLDRGFAEGDRFQFELGLLTLIDCCSQAIDRGDCWQWWWNGRDGGRGRDAR